MRTARQVQTSASARTSANAGVRNGNGAGTNGTVYAITVLPTGCQSLLRLGEPTGPRCLGRVRIQPADDGNELHCDVAVLNEDETPILLMLGLRGVVVKSHGGADQLAFGYAIEQAVEEVENRVLARIEQGLAQRITTAAPAEE